MARRYVEIGFDEYVTETQKAVLFKLDGEGYWVPVSQLEDQDIAVSRSPNGLPTSWDWNTRRNEAWEAMDSRHHLMPFCLSSRLVALIVG